jgi:hypothetical protein
MAIIFMLLLFILGRYPVLPFFHKEKVGPDVLFELMSMSLVRRFIRVEVHSLKITATLVDR